MNTPYIRNINYYETDKMGVVHHSNYIRFLEEARCYFLNINNFPYSEFERLKIYIPVVEVNCKYKHSVTYDDTLLIACHVKDYTGVKLVISYDVIDKNTGNVVIVAESKHCFTNTSFKPINLKKYSPDFHEKFINLKGI